MDYNQLGKTDLNISKITFGTWGIGGEWGPTKDDEATQAIEYAIDQGINFFDTADVYGDGHSETLLGNLPKEKRDKILIATKFGRGDNHADPQCFTKAAISATCEKSLTRLKRDTLDLYQVHCASFDVLKNSDVFDALEALKQEGKIRYYGVSVETIEEGMWVIDHTNASSLQVIFNMLRQKPLEELFPNAIKNNVGILARVPLASGLLTGKFKTGHTFNENDHRNFNQDGQKFNVGETFGGLPFEKGIQLVDQLKEIIGADQLAQKAIRWSIDSPGVSTTIAGMKNVKQVQQNIEALTLPPYSDQQLTELHDFYWKEVHEFVRGLY